MSFAIRARRIAHLILVLFIIVGTLSVLAAAQMARKKSRGSGGTSPDDYTKPQLMSADTNPTLRYPVASGYGRITCGWLDVTRKAIRYSVVQPPDKISDGFDMSTTEITDMSIEQSWLVFRRSTERKKYSIFYLSQERCGATHGGRAVYAASSAGSLGTASIFQAIRNFDNVLAMVKPPEPVIAAPVATPPPAPAPSAPPSPPAVVISEPGGAGANQTVDLQDSPLVVRGVAMDSTGIPVVNINGRPANMRPQSTQAAEFWSEPLPLQSGANPIRITAVNSGHVETNVTFTIRYTPKAPPFNPKALGKAEIISLLQGAVPSSRVAGIVKDRGVKFTPTAEDLNDIRAAGGDDELIQAIQQAVPPR